LARKGRYITSQSILSGEEREAFLAELAGKRPEAEASIEEQVQELETIIVELIRSI
jgi:hypothetical protein